MGIVRLQAAGAGSAGLAPLRGRGRLMLRRRNRPWISLAAVTLLIPLWMWAPAVAAEDERAASDTTADNRDSESKEDASESPRDGSDAKKDVKKWRLLFDGKSLKGWQITDFAGHGNAKAEDGRLILQFGELLTGVTWDGKAFEFPKSNYEISLEAQRVDGIDFFCGLTFPVGEEHCSLIVGGWGGSLVGLSCIDGYDASENLTTSFEKFENKKWYPIRVRVTDARIQSWIEDRLLVDVEREGKEFSVRWEVEGSRPLGIASYRTTAAIRDFKFRRLTEADLEESNKVEETENE